MKSGEEILICVYIYIYLFLVHIPQSSRGDTLCYTSRFSLDTQHTRPLALCGTDSWTPLSGVCLRKEKPLTAPLR